MAPDEAGIESPAAAAARERVREVFTKGRVSTTPPRRTQPRSGRPAMWPSDSGQRAVPTNGPALDKQACLTSLFRMKQSDNSVGAFEAKNKFSELLEKVGRGATFTITKRDRPVARLVPAGDSSARDRKKAASELRAMSRRYSLAGISVRSLVDEGRK